MSHETAVYDSEKAKLESQRSWSYSKRYVIANAEKKLERLKNLNESDGPVFKISADPRVTKVGKTIRKNSIDNPPVN